MFNLHLDDTFVARATSRPEPIQFAQRNFGLGLPPDRPRRTAKPPLPKVSWPDVGLAFLAGVICALLGFVAAVWYFGG